VDRGLIVIASERTGFNMDQQPNWRVTYNDNAGKTVIVEVIASTYNDAICKASANLFNVYFQSAVQI
jgi:hypothetical protein